MKLPVNTLVPLFFFLVLEQKMQPKNEHLFQQNSLISNTSLSACSYFPGESPLPGFL